MVRRICLPVALLAGALAAVTPLAAQWTGSARTSAMLGANMPIARGPDALAANPANLALPDGPAWSLALPQPTLVATHIGRGFTELGLLTARRRAGLARPLRPLSLRPRARRHRPRAGG